MDLNLHREKESRMQWWWREKLSRLLIIISDFCCPKHGECVSFQWLTFFPWGRLHENLKHWLHLPFHLEFSIVHLPSVPPERYLLKSFTFMKSLLKIGWVSQLVLVVKNLPADGGDRRDTGSIPGLGRSPEGGHGNPVQYSCLENPMDRGAWRATVHRVTKSHTWPKQLSMHVCKSWICNLDKPLWCKNHC